MDEELLGLVGVGLGMTFMTRICAVVYMGRAMCSFLPNPARADQRLLVLGHPHHAGRRVQAPQQNRNAASEGLRRYVLLVSSHSFGYNSFLLGRPSSARTRDILGFRFPIRD